MIKRIIVLAIIVSFMTGIYAQKKLTKFEKVKLTADISHLSSNEKQMLSILFDVAQIMEEIYWQQAFGDKEAFLKGIEDKELRNFAIINYGPWNRLDNNSPFIENYVAKPKGANFYPTDMTDEEFERFDDDRKTSLYTLIRRNEAGNLQCIPYSEAYREQHEKAAELLRQAADLAEDDGLRTYLNLRAEALLTDEYQPSDMAWMDMKTSSIDFVVGPIENYEDALYGYKAAHESFILIKDKEWSEKLSKYASFLPNLQKGLPVDDKYKKEVPGSDADLNAYDVIYYAGDCNAGSKTIAINLPNDEEVQLQKGSRKLQLKNSMQAKFDKIVIPISEMLIAKDQRKYVTFDAFFANVMFHEVAHGLGIKNTINGKGTVRKVLKAYYSAIEEGKADIFGLYLVTKLSEMGEYDNGELMDNYVTFMASLFRSIRFGLASSHGKANMIRFNFFNKMGAFIRNSNGTYSVNFEKMKIAMVKHMQDILKIQGDGDFYAAKKLIEEQAVIPAQLQKDLDRINNANIPVDIYFEQGKDVMGLE